MDALLENFAKVDWLVGATIGVLFVCGLLGGLVLLNQWRRFYISYAVHLERMESERRRADKAEAEAASDMADLRADLMRQMGQMREDHDQAFDRQSDTFKAVIAAKEKDIEFLRMAWHLADEAGREDWGPRLRSIEAYMATSHKFFNEFQRVTGFPQLSAVPEEGGDRSDGAAQPGR